MMISCTITNPDHEPLCIFRVELICEDEVVGCVYVDRHPNHYEGAEIHIEIDQKWRKRWLSRSLRDFIVEVTVGYSLRQGLKILYSTALTPVSPRLLEFFGFTEYYKHQPKTYYYLNCEGYNG